jgi:hypothetical protein
LSYFTRSRRFTQFFLQSLFGWRSQPAILRIREALSEIRKAARKDPILGAEGAVLFLEKEGKRKATDTKYPGAFGALKSPGG